MKTSGVKLVILAALLLMTNIRAYAKTDIPSPTAEFFVNDYADVLDSDAERYIFERGKAYNSGDGTQAVVLTMRELEGWDIEDFSINTAREWGIGAEDRNNGVLILLVTDSRDIRIEVGYGLEGVLNDGKCGRFIRNASDMLSAGDYSGGIKQIYDDVIGELENPSEDGGDEENDGPAELIIAVLIAVILIVIWLAAAKKGGGGRGGFYGGYGGGSFGGGGFSGGGGRGFSGGGGSFGGGGASGKF